MKKNIGIVMFFLIVIFSFVCITNRYIFFPDGEIFEIYFWSRNALIISVINWLFYISIKLMFVEKNEDRKNF
ncbi:TPA: hypothetical protein TX924_002229 [Streptococcus suis]|uniref:hypothetical protein n=1 Tax=Streptococcus suis TaxID=1307 RepID=UPI0025B26EA7|nr:hypothetical protein [Streptococcus suis]MDN2949302.1 hypothetical protein [Streptococcus suis]HEL1910162.1 hypothetical protein [Streptococcus suis]HEL1918407.1 hypothetical protein [Streptococcus suis]HEL2056792.1 hypothetical protein [Streptococcus suis]